MLGNNYNFYQQTAFEITNLRLNLILLFSNMQNNMCENLLVKMFLINFYIVFPLYLLTYFYLVTWYAICERKLKPSISRLYIKYIKYYLP